MEIFDDDYLVTYDARSHLLGILSYTASPIDRKKVASFLLGEFEAIR